MILYSASTNAFYDPAIHGEAVPADGVEITAAEHESLLAGQSAGKRIVADADGRPVAVDLPALPVADLRATAEAEIDRRAGKARAAFIAPGDYQEEEYKRAAEQADAFVAGQPGPFPALNADVEAGTLDPRTGRAVETIAEAADLIRSTRGIWLAKLDEIRRIRLVAKAEIRTASSAEEINAILAGLVWPGP